MKINADFDQRVIVHTDQMDWISSPMVGVTRKPLDRIGEEVARATSFVKYDPGSHFSSHIHGGGEEFIVLEGVFSDEHGDFPKGSYIRNPPTSRHTPGSEPGCVIFVKLWQMDPDDRTHIRIDFNKLGSVKVAERSGVHVQPLFADHREDVRIEKWDRGISHKSAMPNGAEILILTGGASEKGDDLRKESWLRIPPGGELELTAGDQGVVFWIKQGHLNDISTPV